MTLQQPHRCPAGMHTPHGPASGMRWAKLGGVGETMQLEFGVLSRDVQQGWVATCGSLHRPAF